MSRFIKFLILLAAVINLAFVFIFDGRIPSNLSLPFINSETESEEPVYEAAAAEPTQEEAEEAETEILPEEVEAEEPETEEPAEEEVLPRCRITADGGSNIRSGPGTGFDIVTSYPYDTVLTLTGEPEIGWYPILAEDGTEGFIFENQVEILDENTAEENAPMAENPVQ